MIDVSDLLVVPASCRRRRRVTSELVAVFKYIISQTGCSVNVTEHTLS